MNLILHIAKKDFRQSWGILVATLALFALTTWIMATPRQQRNMFVDVETVVLVAWMIATGMLWQREPLPGQRAYWFARPIPWQDLLQAKWLVVTVAIFLPILATHAVIVAANGLPVAPNLAALTWNAATIVALYILPVAVLAAITRNLQQLILWVLAIFAGGLLAMQAHQVSMETHAVANTVTNALNIVALVAILIWQYRTRSTRAGRIVVVALTAFLRTLPFWVPDPVWYALQRAISPQHPVRLTIDTNQVRGRTIPIAIEGLPPGQTAAITSFHNVEVTAVGDRTAEANLTTPPRAINDPWPREVTLRLPPDFARLHQSQPLDVSFLAEITIYDAPRAHSAAVGQTIEMPEYGRCRTWSDGYLRIECQSVLSSAYRIDGQWAAKDEPPKSPLVLRSPEDPSPLTARLFPITHWFGGSGGTSVYSGGRVFFSLRKPIAHVQRRIDLTSIRE